MSVLIEKARSEDIAACKEIFISVWEGIHDEYNSLIGDDLHEVFFGTWKENVDQSFVASMLNAMENGRGFVAKDGKRVAGFAYYRVSEDGKTATIGYNAVSLSDRKKGIGSMLYAALIEAIKAEGIEYVAVTTGLDDAHAPARKAYERAGFKKCLPSVRYFQKLT